MPFLTLRSTFLILFCFLLSQFLFSQVRQENNLPTSQGRNNSIGNPSITSQVTDKSYPETITIQPETCRQQNGSIRITGPGEIREWQYSLDGQNFQSNNTFSNLAAGWYTIYILDEAGYTQVREVELPLRNEMKIEEASITSSDCLNPTGTIQLSITGGNEPYSFAFADRTSQGDPLFLEVGHGNHALRITDALGCTLDTFLVIPKNPCPIYIPNVFSPNGDGVNDLFQIRVAGDENILITRLFIFDRWGNNVYKEYNLHLQSTEEWWDGTYKHFTSSAGIFNYYLEVEFENGQRETFKGNVTLIR
jgi:gliding motility-associated-like protein